MSMTFTLKGFWYMNCKSILYLSVMFILLPMWIGYLWVELLKIKGHISRILHAWVLGFTTILAVTQLVLVPFISLELWLTMAIVIWKLILGILSAISFIFVLKKWAVYGFPWEKCEIVEDAVQELDCQRTESCAAVEGSESAKKSGSLLSEQQPSGNRKWIVIFGVLVAILVLIQAYIPARYEHSDDDDARFIALQVSAVYHDTMYRESPIHADFMYWDQGEVRKDLTSPWAMLMAIVSKEGRIAPAVLSHSYLPFFLILLCYALYLLIGQTLFRGDWEKTFLFLIFLSVIHLAGYTSTHTLASMLLLRIWQGKAVCASFMLPLFFYLFYQVLRKDYKKTWIPMLYVASTGACLLSGIGIVTAPIMLFLYGAVDFCYYRKWRKTFAIWMAAVPCGIYLVYYLI